MVTEKSLAVLKFPIHVMLIGIEWTIDPLSTYQQAMNNKITLKFYRNYYTVDIF